MKKEFDWDNWLSSASYNEVVSKSPALQSVRNLPSYSPDKSLFYLTSEDYDVDTSSQKELNLALSSLTSHFSRALKENNFFNAWVIQVECEEICNLLHEVADDPTEYSDPSVFLTIE